MNPIPPQFKTWQSHLVPLLGISIEEIRRRRKELLAEGVDWMRDGNRVLLTDDAVKKIRASLDLPTQKNAPPSQTSPTPQNAQAGAFPLALDAVNVLPTSRRVFHLGVGLEMATSLVVWQRPANLRIVEAHLKGKDPNDRRNIVRVQVGSNINFVRGMDIPVRMVQKPDLFVFTGRLPRWKGKY